MAGRGLTPPTMLDIPGLDPLVPPRRSFTEFLGGLTHRGGSPGYNSRLRAAEYEYWDQLKERQARLEAATKATKEEADRRDKDLRTQERARVAAEAEGRGRPERTRLGKALVGGKRGLLAYGAYEIADRTGALDWALENAPGIASAIGGGAVDVADAALTRAAGAYLGVDPATDPAPRAPELRSAAVGERDDASAPPTSDPAEAIAAMRANRGSTAGLPERHVRTLTRLYGREWVEARRAVMPPPEPAPAPAPGVTIDLPGDEYDIERPYPEPQAAPPPSLSVRSQYGRPEAPPVLMTPEWRRQRAAEANAGLTSRTELGRRLLGRGAPPPEPEADEEEAAPPALPIGYDETPSPAPAEEAMDAAPEPGGPSFAGPGGESLYGDGPGPSPYGMADPNRVPLDVAAGDAYRAVKNATPQTWGDLETQLPDIVGRIPPEIRDRAFSFFEEQGLTPGDVLAIAEDAGKGVAGAAAGATLAAPLAAVPLVGWMAPTAAAVAGFFYGDEGIDWAARQFGLDQDAVDGAAAMLGAIPGAVMTGGAAALDQVLPPSQDAAAPPSDEEEEVAPAADPLTGTVADPVRLAPPPAATPPAPPPVDPVRLAPTPGAGLPTPPTGARVGIDAPPLTAQPPEVLEARRSVARGDETRYVRGGGGGGGGGGDGGLDGSVLQTPQFASREIDPGDEELTLSPDEYEALDTGPAPRPEERRAVGKAGSFRTWLAGQFGYDDPYDPEYQRIWKAIGAGGRAMVNRDGNLLEDVSAGLGGYQDQMDAFTAQDIAAEERGYARDQDALKYQLELDKLRIQELEAQARAQQARTGRVNADIQRELLLLKQRQAVYGTIPNQVEAVETWLYEQLAEGAPVPKELRAALAEAGPDEMAQRAAVREFAITWARRPEPDDLGDLLRSLAPQEGQQ